MLHRGEVELSPPPPPLFQKNLRFTKERKIQKGLKDVEESTRRGGGRERERENLHPGRIREEFGKNPGRKEFNHIWYVNLEWKEKLS